VGYASDSARVTSRVASAGISDLGRDTISYRPKKRFLLPAAAVVLAALFLSGMVLLSRNFFKESRGSQNAKETGSQKEKNPLVTGDEFTRAMMKELGAVSESESARKAFNTLAAFWNGAPLPEIGEGDPGREMEGAALARDLRLYRFSGNLGGLLRIDIPAVLELMIPGLDGKRFLSLVGIENERLLVDLPISGRGSFSFREFETYWSGHGFLLWKDHLGLLAGSSPRLRGDRMGRLQDLLREAGAYRKPSSGVYDDDTVLAVRELQSSVGIERDGIIGGQTLMLLYRSVGRFGVPRLTGGKK
jgi:general secretion pathway protein A